MSSSSILRQTLARSALRSRTTGRRYASNDAAQKKAQETLASAQQSAGKILDGLKKLLEPAGQKAGQLLGSYKQPLLYNLSVTREILKQIYVKEGLKPPSIEAVRTAYETLWTRAINPAYWRTIASNGEIVRVGIYGVEAYTIFKVGEILGRRSLVGYNIE